jgi:hypothetical protein
MFRLSFDNYAIRIYRCVHDSSRHSLHFVLKDPIPTFSHLVSEVKTLYPDLLYLHVVESRFSGNDITGHPSRDSNDFIRDTCSASIAPTVGTEQVVTDWGVPVGRLPTRVISTSQLGTCQRV